MNHDLVSTFSCPRVDTCLAIEGYVILRRKPRNDPNNDIAGSSCVVVGDSDDVLGSSFAVVNPDVRVCSWVPLQLIRLWSIEALTRAFVIAVRVTHHATLIIISSSFATVRKIDVVADFVHESTRISAPLVVVHRRICDRQEKQIVRDVGRKTSMMTI